MTGEFEYASNEEPVEIIHSNLDQNIIKISEDRLRLYLAEYFKRIEQGKDWLGYLGIIVTIIITFQTAVFKEFLNLSSATWQAIYIGTLIVCCGFFVKCLYQRLTSLTIDELLEKIKNRTARHDTLVKKLSLKMKKEFNSRVSKWL